MAVFKFTGTITVYGAADEQDAINQLQIMVDDYDDCNPGFPDIIIHWEKVEDVSDTH